MKNLPHIIHTPDYARGDVAQCVDTSKHIKCDPPHVEREAYLAAVILCYIDALAAIG